MDNQNFVGNDVAPVTAQDSSSEAGEQSVNPGAIRKSTTQSLLSALSNASGTQFQSVEDALAYMARVGAQNTNGGNAQPSGQPKAQQSSNGRVTTNDLHEQFSKLQNDLAVKEQRLREKELDSDIQRAMGDKFDSDLLDYALNKVKNNIQWNDDGTYAIVNQKGQERYGSDGNPLTISGLVNEVAQGNPKLLRQSNTNSGSGLRPGQSSFTGALEESIPDYSRDPAAFNAWANKNGLGKGTGLKGLGVSATVSSSSRKVL
jgi:hypothetical protein